MKSKKIPHPIIYKTINKHNGKIYIGKSKYNDPTYYGSGTRLNYAIKKYGIESFEKIIIETCTENELNSREIYWIDYYKSIDSNIGYNISTGGQGGSHYWDTLETDDRNNLSMKIGNSLRGKRRKPHSTITKDRMSKAFSDLVSRDETFVQRRALKKLKQYTCVNHKLHAIFYTDNLKMFCYTHNLNFGSMQHNARTRKNMCNDHWSCRLGTISGNIDIIIDNLNAEITTAHVVMKEKMSSFDRSGKNNANAKRISFIHDDGRIVNFNGNFYKDCFKLLGCSYNNIRNLITGISSNVNGWSVI